MCLTRRHVLKKLFLFISMFSCILLSTPGFRGTDNPEAPYKSKICGNIRVAICTKCEFDQISVQKRSVEAFCISEVSWAIYIYVYIHTCVYICTYIPLRRGTFEAWAKGIGDMSAVQPTCCNTLQHTATYCNTLQHTATHCNMHVECLWRHEHRGLVLLCDNDWVCYSVLQWVEVSCNGLQWVAVCRVSLLSTGGGVLLQIT